MKRESTVVVIDDTVKRHTALIEDLELDYKKAVPIDSPDEAIKYIEDHLDTRMIVILDYKFGKNEPTGKFVLEKIREKSHLIPVILWSAEDIDKKDFAEFINNGTMALVKSKEAHEEILVRVKEADIQLSNSVEGAIEEWLEIHGETERANTFLISSDGKKCL